MANFLSIIKKSLIESSNVKKRAAKNLSEHVAKAAKITIKAYKRGNKVLFCGNGGSAADCQHLAAELVGRFKKERKGLPAIALTTDTSILTALANDYGYNLVFTRQVEALGIKGDVLYGLSTSGNSTNIIRACEFAKGMDIYTIGFLGGDGGKLKEIVDLPIVVPTRSSDRIQEVHITIGHIICGLIEQELFK